MRIVSVALRKVRSATTFSAFEIALILPVFLLLGVARLAIIWLPFRTYARRLGKQVALEVPPSDLSAADLTRAKRIGKVVRRTAQITPWQSLCLGQALVAAVLMRTARIPYRVFFGLVPASDTQAPDLLAAHAWVRTGGTNLTGGQDVGKYTVVMVFEHQASAAL